MKKSLIKKIAVGVMLMSMLGSAAAFAADQEVDPNNGATIDVSGSASATTIVVTVPTALSFAINPNSGTPFTSVPATITNGTYAPIDFQVLGITSEVGTAVKVVSSTLHEDQEWLALGKNATTSQIALGIKEVGGAASTIWSPAEVNGATPSVVSGTIQLDPSGTKDIMVDAKHGNAWDSAKTLNYKLFVRVGLTES